MGPIDDPEESRTSRSQMPPLKVMMGAIDMVEEALVWKPAIVKASSVRYVPRQVDEMWFLEGNGTATERSFKIRQSLFVVEQLTCAAGPCGLP